MRQTSSFCVADVCNLITYRLVLVALVARVAFAHGNKYSSAVCTPRYSKEYIGDDVVAPIRGKTLPRCCDECAKLKNCSFFTFNVDTNLCSFKNEDAHMSTNAAFISGYVGAPPPAPPVPTRVHVDLVSAETPHWTTGKNFVCWNIDASAGRGFFWRNLSTAAPFGAQLARQASALGRVQEAGHSMLRFGGTGNDYLIYCGFGATKFPLLPSEANRCLNQTMWSDFLSFVHAANAKLIFGLSMRTGKDSKKNAFPYPWDPQNAREILKWTLDHGYGDLIGGFELGNEQDREYTGAQQAHYFEILYNLTVELWPNPSRRPMLWGPDPHGLHIPTGADPDTKLAWLTEWLDHVQERGVPIHGVTHHEYVEVEPVPTGYTSPDRLDLNTKIASVINKTVREHATFNSRDVRSQFGLWGGEIGPHNGGKPVCNHSTMRWAVFGDSLWYADALAAMAFNGYTGFCRQDFIGADYGMSDCATGKPLPDYWTALAFGKTMGPKVLETQNDGGDSLRSYAHCTANSRTGAVTVLLINLANRSTTVDFGSALTKNTNLLGKVTQKYVLTDSVDPKFSLINTTGIMGTGIRLNGKELTLEADGSVPTLIGEPVMAGELLIPPESISFLVFENAAAKACM